jgi:UDP-N-acetylglucosamine--N-acetylmuramyl-(pentapeptide) pyrophosphoryl-undecaprenol N-acetylglucosamine transferase
MKRKLLLVASTGGHLAQMYRLSDRLGASDCSLWITFDTPQSRGLLTGRRTLFVPYVAPRDWRAALRAARHINRVLGAERFDEAISTGAALAVAALPMARKHGIPARYIESVSRIEGPSLSGRLLAASHLVSLQCQHSSWAGGRWEAVPSVLEEYERLARPTEESRPPRLFVTLGTIKPYRFDSLVDAVLATGLANEETVWQLGVTTRAGLPGTAHDQMSSSAFEQTASEADVVITHAGVGSILGLLDKGIYPVVVPRAASRREHVDDHQAQAAALVDRTGVGLAVESTALNIEHIVEARGFAIRAMQTRSASELAPGDSRAINLNRA